MKRKDWARSPPTTRNIGKYSVTEYFPFREVTPIGMEWGRRKVQEGEQRAAYQPHPEVRPKKKSQQDGDWVQG